MVAYNSGATLGRCLSALAAQTLADFEAVVVDNASGDGAVDRCVPDDPRFSVMRLSDNLGFAAALTSDCSASWRTSIWPSGCG